MGIVNNALGEMYILKEDLKWQVLACIKLRK